MTKHCIICEKPAILKIKDTNDFYCQECAEESFADLSVLVTLEEEAHRLKQFLQEKTQDEQDSSDSQDNQ